MVINKSIELLLAVRKSRGASIAMRTAKSFESIVSVDSTANSIVIIATTPLKGN